MSLRVKRREMCWELCSRRAYLEKLLLGKDIDIEKCVKMCIGTLGVHRIIS
jgi:hypothetical protein